jgi:hypothetical protein
MLRDLPQEEGAMREMQLIYMSKPFGYDDFTLDNILIVARAANKRDGITGALISRHDMFIQLLEGPRDRVAAAFARIQRDDRHVDIVELWSSDIETRLFKNWEMHHDPAPPWMWTAEQVRNGVVQNATASDLLAMFSRIAAEAPAMPDPLNE